MTGGTGSGTVGGNVVQGAFNFCPGGRCVTVAAELTRRIKGEIAGTLRNVMTMGRVDRIKTGEVTGRTVTRRRLCRSKTDQGPGIDIVAAVTAIMRAGCDADQGVVMTTGALARTDGHDRAVVGCDRVDHCPGAEVTGPTVTTGGEVLAIGCVGGHQRTVDVVTAGAIVMRVIGSADQSVIVTRSAALGCNLNQSAVVRDIRCMGGIPGIGMTAGTVTRGRLANREADPGAGGGVVAAIAIGMGCGCGADQGVIMTVRTTGGAGHGDDSAVNRGTGVQAAPGAAMAGSAVATGGEVFTNGQTS